MIRTKVLLIGPLPLPTTGVSLANQVVTKNLDAREGYQVNTINTSYNKFDEDLGAFSFNKFLFYLKLNLYVYKIFKSDIVYVTPGQTFFGVVKYALFFLISRLLNKELIIHIHGNHIGKEYILLKGIKKRIFKLLIGSAKKGIVLSESLTGNMTPFVDNNNVYVLYNFVEDYLFATKPEISNKTATDKPRIIFLSNLMEEKGIFDLLEALTILEEKGIDFEAKIAGNIDSKNDVKLNTYFKRLKNTKYIGVVSGKEKRGLLLWANVFVLPTYYIMEGQPISILENMATGNVVLTTKHAGIPDVFQDSVNGYYVDKKSPMSIVNAVLKCQKESIKTRGIMNNNYMLAQKKYRVKHFIDNIINIFESI
jgi:glycosyltransferase involved in cell wall biosynthesis